MSLSTIGFLIVIVFLILAIYILVQSIKSHAKLEKDNQTKDKLMQSIIDNIPSALYIKDLNGQYLFLNKMTAQVLNRPHHVIVGNTTSVLYKDTPDRLIMYQQTDDDVALTGKVASFEETVDTAGSSRTYLVTKFPLLNDVGAVQYIGVLATDITERKDIENKLREAKQDAEDSKKGQETFLATMSHEIRTPMNGVIGMANLLLTTNLTQEQNDFTQSIHESANNLLTIINDLLDFSKIKAGKLELEEIPFNIRSTIAKAIYPIRYRAEEKLIKLSMSVADNVPEVLIGDPLRLQQIIINLANNAVKFTSVGTVNIIITATDNGNKDIRLYCEVRDSGIGIPDKIIGRIFDSFTQNNAEDTRKYGGTGLGLAIVKQLVEMQHGQISVKSTEGIGSIFSFNIPYQIGESGSITEKIFAGEKDKNIKRLEGLSILIAEDNIINQKVVVNTLQKQGATVVIANNGREAIEHIKSGKQFHLLLMDLQMPEIDGHTATQHIRQVLEHNIPIVAMTADALKGEEDKCLAIGMNGYISKPFEPEVLYQTILNLAKGDKIQITQTTSNKAESGTDVDFSMLEELAEGDGNYIIEVLDIFLSTMPEGMLTLRTLIKNNDWTGTSKQAHFLKSSLGIIKIGDAYDLMAAIEHIAKEEGDKSEIRKIFAAVEQKISEGYWHTEQKKKALLEKM